MFKNSSKRSLKHITLINIEIIDIFMEKKDIELDNTTQELY